MGFRQPEIQFARTVDGVAIAYWEIGSGPPLVVTQPLAISHAELEWQVPSIKAFYLEAAKYFRLIRYDPRGSGMSDDPSAESGSTLEAYCYDIDAVVNASDVDEFDLAGAVSMGPVAIQYTADRPTRVSHLVLFDTGPVIADLPLAPFIKAMSAAQEFGIALSLTDRHPDMATADAAAIQRMSTESI